MNTCKSYNCYNNVTTVIHVVMVMAELVNGYNRSGKYFIIVSNGSDNGNSNLFLW